MAGDFVLNVGLLFGGAAAALRIGRALLLRLAPAWLVGPGGFLIDTTGGLGIFQMLHDERHRPSWLTDGSSPGDRSDGNGCD